MIQGKNYWVSRPKDDPKMDWNKNAKDWVSDYCNSASHPHRNALVNILAYLKPNGLLEIGASCGPNLVRFKEAFPDMVLSGIDCSVAALEERGDLDIVVGDVMDIPFTDKSFECVLSDAVLMYIEPKDIKQAMDEITRVAEKYVILVEWRDDSLVGVVKSYHWARDYKSILEWYGFDVEMKNITRDIWPTETWVKNGVLCIAKRNGIL